MSADALEDDFELQEFPEDSEIVASEHIDVISDQELLSYEVPEPISVTKKRPASEQQTDSNKKKKSKKPKKSGGYELVNFSNASEFNAYLWQQFMRDQSPHLTEMELMDLKEKYQISDEMTVMPTEHHVQLSAFIENGLFKSSKLRNLKENGQPQVLVLSPSAIRAVEVVRDLKQIKQKNIKVAKLFAKHMKISEQLDFLTKNVCHIGVGTPNRIHKLLELHTELLNKVEYVVLDGFVDAKQRNLLQISECRHDFFKLIHDSVFREKMMNSSQLRLAWFHDDSKLEKDVVPK